MHVESLQTVDCPCVSVCLEFTASSDWSGPGRASWEDLFRRHELIWVFWRLSPKACFCTADILQPKRNLVSLGKALWDRSNTAPTPQEDPHSATAASAAPGAGEPGQRPGSAHKNLEVGAHQEERRPPAASVKEPLQPTPHSLQAPELTKQWSLAKQRKYTAFSSIETGKVILYFKKKKGFRVFKYVKNHMDWGNSPTSLWNSSICHTPSYKTLMGQTTGRKASSSVHIYRLQRKKPRAL